LVRGCLRRRRAGHRRDSQDRPTDEHADTPKERSAAVKKADDGLKDSFPASDPPSSTQPPKTVEDGARKEHLMVMTKYEIFGTDGVWRVRHDGKAENEYEGSSGRHRR
jgi:hypothetical protein